MSGRFDPKHRGSACGTESAAASTRDPRMNDESLSTDLLRDGRRVDLRGVVRRPLQSRYLIVCGTLDLCSCHLPIAPMPRLATRRLRLSGGVMLPP